ncbi:MAG: ornithine cyclodeaminase [Alistipes indistinctus]
MKIIKHSDITALGISPRQFMEWVREALLTQYECDIPPKISIHLPDDGFFNTMPCYIPKQNVMGVKVVNRFLANTPALDASMLLYDTRTGELKALMDASYITSMRTGAVAATSIKYLKKKQICNKLSMLGLGVTARATMWCLLESFPDEFFEVTLLRYKDQAEQFAERFKTYPNVSFHIVNSNKELIVGAEIIVSCITSATELIGRNIWFDEGVLLVPVHTRGFQNCDLFFDKVYGDLTGQISGFKYFDRFKIFDEFAQVVIGKNPGRENNQERILVYNIGMALHDIYIGNRILSMFEPELEREIAFKEFMPKFYI